MDRCIGRKMDFRLELAEKKDEAEIQEFFEAQDIVEGFRYHLKRPNGLFKSYDLHLGEYKCFVLRSNQDNNIYGMATLIFREAYIQNQLEKICWATDLLIANQRDAITHWSNILFPELIKHIKEMDVKYCFTSVSKANAKAFNSLIRPGGTRKNKPRYHLISNYSLVSIHGKKPSFIQNFLNGIKIKPLNINRLEELCMYLNSKSQQRLLGVHYTPDLLLEREKVWPEFHLQNFYVAYDSKQNIVGTYCLWNSKNVQKMILKSYSSKRAENFRDILRFLSWFKLARPLPKVNEEFEFQNITHLFSDNSDIFESLVHHAYNRANHQFLLYPQFEDHFMRLAPKDFLSNSISYGLYCIMEAHEQLPEELRLNHYAPPPELEVALLSTN